MPREELLVRLAVCYARSGDRIRGDAQVEKLKDLAARRRISVPADFVSLVAEDVARPHGMSAKSVAGGSEWLMPLGTPARDGSMKAVAEGAIDRPLSESWVYKIDAFESAEFKKQIADGKVRGDADDMDGRRMVMMRSGRRQFRARDFRARPRRPGWQVEDAKLVSDGPGAAPRRQADRADVYARGVPRHQRRRRAETRLACAARAGDGVVPRLRPQKDAGRGRGPVGRGVQAMVRLSADARANGR